MPLPIIVTAYSGYKTNERPKSFLVDEDWYDIASIEDRWLEPDFEYFKVRTTDQKTYLLRYEPQGAVWTLRGDFDGGELLPRPGIEVVTVGTEQVSAAEQQIEGCEHCHPDDAELPFDQVLQQVTGSGGMVDFVMAEVARCPSCR